MSSLLIAKEAGYRLLPFRFLRLDDASDKNILLTAETGEYLFAPETLLNRLVRKELEVESSTYKDLLARHFIYEPGGHDPIPEMAAQYRGRKSFLLDGPALHIFVVTLRCNHTCQYCQVSRAPQGDAGHDMSAEDALHAVERVFESPSQVLTVEFQGGEPLLAFERIQQVVEAIEARNTLEQRSIQYVITTTLHHLTDTILDFTERHRIQFSTSLDGPAFLHNANRPTPNKDAYERTVDGIHRVRARLGHDGVSALTTLTSRSLEHPRAIIDEYVALGFNSISLRPLSPYGFAKTSARRLDYSMSEFIDFYKQALAYLISLNAQGTFLSEGYASLLLTNILTPFSSGYVDLRSPLGAGLGTLVYNYDGDVYPSDESRMLLEMGENGLRLGNVRQPLTELLKSPVIELLLAAGIAEALPGCSDCALVPYCGADPIEHFARLGDPIGHRAFSSFCEKNMGLLTHLFTLLRDGDEKTQRVLMSWLSRRSLDDLPFTGYRG
ncbi:His-Xaa-Ser system radical SAM maturase HxsB [Pseudomonas gingeri]|uniref:His-Xaa-Ser system radical SAM maturase HxsB n=1 Tax=Pseudomonas gingeri TaxID=117681 RepID=UPI0015A474A9|nr:His-Xaa-Ser system radical SAM maturase HxsB [Pseudomonas gingeri]NVZ65215.1 His-Xaa-Ser system radical SAM maturase HxsB [Pseudomonas gingeri]NVZ75820.1 His-Xaa-Ser system radical SAM maturase HxsB [Pseudomonas gingeri]NWD09676.1 His-Xaa-Ser system radical SAM maturase HxsB [Pseudomonas gingeri]NWE36791.1 His-Xaa-Ser system radical SAM maturase HxsB [Pseudomonas gingeri]NWE61135.1 His-Xaa-Ser system radical SAM maturase HxsB [Pseudomonas gingeri]